LLDHCWRSGRTRTTIRTGQVYFDTNRVIKEAFGEANFPVPEQHIAVRNGVGSEKAFAAGA
jgi:hypothetical protein